MTNNLLKAYSQLLKKFCLLILFLLLNLIPFIPEVKAQGTTFYLAPNGEDRANGGTIDAPWRTMIYALSQMHGGDTLYLRGGTYTGHGYSIGNGITIPSGTSWDSATTISAYPSETVILQPTPEMAPSGYWIGGFGFTSGSDHYIILQNLIIDGINCGGSINGIYYRGGSHHLRFQNLEIKNFGSVNPGGAAAGIIGGGYGSHHIEVLNNNIHHIAGDSTDSGHGMYFTADDSIVDGNLIHDNTGVGIQVQDAEPGYGAYRNIIRNNRIYNNRGVGAIAAVDGQDNQVYNNVVYGNSGDGIAVTPIGKGTPSADRNLIYNNTIYKNTGNCISVGNFGPADGNQVINNICYANGADQILIQPSATNTLTQTNLIGIDPQFVNPTEDFHLRSNSAAIDAGSWTPVTTDIENNSRPAASGFDIGAYEFGGTPAPTPNPTPSPSPSPEPTPTPTPTPPPESISAGMIPQSQMSIVSVSTDAENARNILDGNLDSRWTVESFPAEAIINLGGSYNVSGLIYSESWSPIGNYEIYVSTDGINWGSPVASGFMTELPAHISFRPQTGSYLKLKVLSAPAGYSFVAEIQVFGDGSTAGIVNPVNNPPTVNAGSDQTVTLPAVANLSGSATDDGLPTKSLTTVWSKKSGPGTISLGNSSQLSTTASFSAAGTYILQLTANDGAESSVDEMTVVVHKPAVDTTAPIFKTGPVASVGKRSVTISWSTDEPATSEIQYGKTTDYGTTITKRTLSTSRSLTLSNLNRNTVYYYQVMVKDKAGNARSMEKSFKTNK